MEQNEIPVIGKPVLTKEGVVAKINLALTKEHLTVSAQKLQDEADALVFNQDNIPVISGYLKKLKHIDEVAVSTHKELKAPYLEAGRVCDLGKNTILAITDAIRTPIMDKWNKLNAEIERKDREQKAEAARKKAIEDGIENNIIEFSAKIACCDTNEQLLAVERSINLEKSPSRKEKYGEFHEIALSKYDSILIPIIKSQKEKIKEKEAIRKQLLVAELNDDAAKVEELRGLEEKIDNEILQNQVDVQQNAISQISLLVQVAEEILPKIKAADIIKFEIADLATAVKKSSDLLDVSIKFRECQKVAMTLKEAGTFDDKDEVTVNGIRFFIDKKFKL